MLVAVNHRITSTVPADGAVAAFAVEDNLPYTEILAPAKLLFINFGTEDVTVTIVRRLDLGSSADPEDDGSNDETVVDAATITAGESYSYDPGGPLRAAEDTPYLEHRVSYSGSGNAEDNIVHLLVRGAAEETTRSNILNFQRNA